MLRKLRMRRCWSVHATAPRLMVTLSMFDATITLVMRCGKVYNALVEHVHLLHKREAKLREQLRSTIVHCSIECCKPTGRDIRVAQFVVAENGSKFPLLNDVPCHAHYDLVVMLWYEGFGFLFAQQESRCRHFIMLHSFYLKIVQSPPPKVAAAKAAPKPPATAAAEAIPLFSAEALERKAPQDPQLYGWRAGSFERWWCNFAPLLVRA
eukprot:520242-Amphidinium_carterae.1